MTTGRLGYNSDNGRYGVLVMDLWLIEGFHCGDTLEVWDSDSEQWIPTRMEMRWKNEWYLVGTKYSGKALEGLKVRVNK